MNSLADLFRVSVDARGQNWYDAFFGQVPDELFVPGDPAVITGPDQFSYTTLFTPPPEASSRAVPLKTVIEEATLKGTGIVLNPKENGADWVFTYGNLWSYRAFGSFFIRKETNVASGPVTVKKDAKLLVGAPSELMFPAYARRVVGDYLKKVLQIEKPGVAILGPIGNAPSSLAFTIFPDHFQSNAYYEKAMQRMTWFLPSHYVITGLPKSQRIDYTSL